MSGLFNSINFVNCKKNIERITIDPGAINLVLLSTMNYVVRLLNIP